MCTEAGGAETSTGTGETEPFTLESGESLSPAGNRNVSAGTSTLKVVDTIFLLDRAC